VPSSVARILRKLRRENAFYFFTSIGNYTGQNAASLEEFVKKIGEVDDKSLEFHFYRGDFEKWVDEVLEDRELAKEIRDLRNRVFHFRGRLTTDELYSIKKLRDNYLNLAYSFVNR